MDLQQFVAITISQIVRGVDDARKALNDTGNHVNPGFYTHPGNMANQGKLVATDGKLIQLVEFDVAVTVSSTAASSATPSIGVVSGDAYSESAARTGQNRIKFTVPISLP